MNAMSVSVVIPVLNEEKSIAVLLDSLFGQTRQPDEVVITDGGSSDRTVEIIGQYIRNGRPIRLIRSAGAYPGVGRNLGVQAASHDLIALTDAGIRLDAHWLESLLQPIEADPSVAVVYGTFEPVADTFFKQCAALAYVAAPIDWRGQRFRGPYAASSLIRRNVWSAVGGFPPYRAAEDLVFIERIKAAGFKTAYAPEAVAHWSMAPGVWSTFRRFALYSRHNLIAGRANRWHYGLLRFYALASAGVWLGCSVTHYAFLIPLLLLMFRVFRILWAKRRAFDFMDSFRGAAYFFGLAGVILLLDAATIWGAWVWLWHERDIQAPLALRSS